MVKQQTFSLGKDDQSACFPMASFPNPPIGENPTDGRPTVVNKRAKGSGDSADKVREVNFLKLLLSVYLKV